jgi:hypothetical protein
MQADPKRIDIKSEYFSDVCFPVRLRALLAALMAPLGVLALIVPLRTQA